MDEIEIWKPIPGYEGYYEASSLGRVKALERNVFIQSRNCYRKYETHIMVPQLNRANNNNERYIVRLSKDGITKTRALHRLIIEAFHGMPAPGMECCHNDGNRFNNRADNLRWGTKTTNVEDKKVHGTIRKGHTCPNSSLTKEQALKIRHEYTGTKGEMRALARHYKVDPSVISRLIGNKIYVYE